MTPSKLYFDTNIYHFIDALKEGKAVRQFLDDFGYEVRASACNVMEIYANPETFSRVSEVKTLVTVASCFDGKPQSWLHAWELQREIARCRPQWLRRIRFTKKENQFLKAHLQMWKNAQSVKLPSAQSFAVYRRAYEGGVRTQRGSQKALRERLRQGATKFHLCALGKRSQSVTQLDFGDPEVYWRVECLLAWFYALVNRTPASRDYADWLDPYVKHDAFRDTSYGDFWLRKVAAENVPRNRLTGLVAYYQELYKITHGNAIDQLHANNLLDVDVFLGKVIAKFSDGTARPLLLNRQASSALGELRTALGLP